ncbi:Inosine-5'-monophosphate dehydrogenase [Candidatus Rhodobacter oscarellae]|uniref:Inosine-5'-monophosphate dehydrogenase n=2 Tax=Candidatus Rhodobacter oscarellae TaxID=1675527 RepID=A0A0J9GRW0_9RHOB|nr:Inosine-5'-monophosphate dehydrogenase [Candidatus Rhodobacter lobularis]
MRQDQAAPGSKSQSVNLSNAHPTVADILGGKGGEVFSITPTETLGRAVEELRDRRIGALVVTDGAGKLAGILSERDIVRKLAETPGQTLPQQVGDVMTRKVVTCAPDDPLLSVLKRMTAGRFRHMPVVEGEGEELIGVVTIGDVIHHRLTQLEHEALQLKQLIVG